MFVEAFLAGGECCCVCVWMSGMWELWVWFVWSDLIERAFTKNLDALEVGGGGRS